MFSRATFSLTSIDHVRVDDVTTEIGDFESKEGGECVRERLLTQCPEADEDFTETAAGVSLHGERLLQLFFGNKVRANQLLAESALADLRRGRVGRARPRSVPVVPVQV